MPDHSSRGVLTKVVCLNVIVNPSIMRRHWPTRGCCAVGGGGVVK